MAGDPIRVSSEEINCLIYAYFQDSGFNHSAFALRNESRLYNSRFSTKHIPRGELIDLLSKALLYVEVESHWRNDALTTNCKSGFTLLEPHICSLEPPPKDDEIETPQPNGISDTAHSQPLKPYTRPRNDASPSFDAPHLHDAHPHPSQGLAPVPELGSKRKTSPVPVDGPAGKRAKHGSIDMEVNESSVSPARSPVVPTPPPDVDRADPPKSAQQRKAEEKAIMRLNAGPTEVFVCAFNPVKPSLLAAGQKDGSVYIWDLPTPPDADSPLYATPPEQPHLLEASLEGQNKDITSLDWSPDGQLLAVASYDAMLRIGTADGELYFSHPHHQRSIFAAKFSKNGRWLLTASLDHTACIWDVQEKRIHRQYRYHKDCCLDADWINEDTFVTSGADARILIMHVDQDEPIKNLTGHKDEINEVRVNASGTRLASASDDGTAAVWKIDDLRGAADAIPGLTASDLVVRLEGHTLPVNKVAWCPDRSEGTNERVATISFDTTVRLWDAVTGACLHVFRGHSKPVYSLTFSPDGKFIASGDSEGSLRICDTKTYETLYSWAGSPTRPPIFDLNWQQRDGINRLALGLESGVALLDVNKLESYHEYVKKSSSEAAEESR